MTSQTTTTPAADCTPIPCLQFATRDWEAAGCPMSGPVAMMFRLVTRLIWAGWEGPQAPQA